jgi:lysophospholipase L1-like esterase
MVGPPPIADAGTNARIAALDAALAVLCRRIGQPYVPVFAALAADPAWIHEVAAGDGAHPAAGGYAQLARVVGASPHWNEFLAACPVAA